MHWVRMPRGSLPMHRERNHFPQYRTLTPAVSMVLCLTGRYSRLTRILPTTQQEALPGQMGGVILYGAGTDVQNPYEYVRRVCEWAKT
jgi:hypothetical protein